MPKRIERVARQCERETCTNEFEVPVNGRGSDRKYCGRDCASKATAAARGVAYRESHGYTPPVCPCGKTIESTAAWGYAYTKKYCNDECRRKYAPVRRPNPEKWAKYTCQRPGCGNTFQRRKANRNAKLYCSMECSNKMTKTRRFYAVEDFDIVFESSYEAFFWSACMIAKIPVERFDRGQGVAWDPAHPDRWYAPDFWLPRHNAAVEIKGVEDDHDQARWKAFRESGRTVYVISREWLEQGSPQTLAALLDGLVLQSLDTDPKEWVDVDPVSGKVLRRWVG